MRHEHETATSFNQLKEITQIMQVQKRSAKTSDNAEASEIASQSVPKTKATAHAKNHALKPTKKAFSERQITAFRDNSQASANLSRGTKGSYNANAFKTEQANNSSLRDTKSAKAQKPGLENNQSNQKGAHDEA
ncbi:hypothetical protein [Helicobacter pylori]|uniref:hypothetical protein n=1 Tax=Helicobacter pylori TaxID=210 RepID=UPI000FDD2111|nr:hypothetical protein [Helicobacter pylori]RVY51926.1 hypothetical protein ECC35_06910 [Helicobacter pylori]